MGKAEEQPLHSSVVSQDSGQNVEAGCGCGCAAIRKFIGVRCILVLLWSAAVFLSAVFWLPPFLRYADQKDLRPDARYKGHDIVASFILKKPVSLLQENILQLEDDIFEEIPVPSTKVTVLSLDPLSGSNKTKVVFAVDPDGSEMSQPAVSLIRASFKDLVTDQSMLRLTSSLFGDTDSFEVLRFKGGITIVPPQKAFLLQKQSLFNFTLNSSIDQIRMDFLELTTQLKSGLHLASYENLYVILSNTEGSTVAPPTIVQASIILEIGNNPPSSERLKQLAQTIANSHSKNLGLNHTEFGRVKQVRLSSILQHSLHGHDGSGTSWSPSPAPLTHSHHHHHHHHHGHHHHHHHNAHLAPAVLPAHVPAPAPAPANGRGVTPPEVGSPAAGKSVPPPRSSEAESPNCQFGHRKRPTRKAGKHSHLTPAVSPITAPHSSAASPKRHVEPPAYASHSVPALSPLPNVAFAHAEGPSKNEPAAEHSNARFHGPSTSSSSSFAGHLWTVKRASLLFLILVLHL